MSDLISRADAIRIVDQFSREEMFHYMESLELDVRATQICHSAIEAVGTIKEQIEALPSADRTGHWIKESYIGWRYECPLCGHVMVSDEVLDFCPSCGADMRGDESE